MAERLVNRYVRQLAAMHLILSMRDEAGVLRNLEYVRKNPLPPTVQELKGDTEGLTYLRDMFYLFEFNLYETYHKMLHEENAGETLEAAMHHTSSVIEKTTIRMAEPMNAFWSGPAPHCEWVLREVVSQLLL
jgi:hypothetical protein